MRVIIAGSRDITDYHLVESAIERSGFSISEVVSGGARGVDELGERWGKENEVPIRIFPAAWSQHGRAAGPYRNRRMAKYADALIAVWDGKSKGTRNMLKQAHERGLRIYLARTDGKPDWTN